MESSRVKSGWVYLVGAGPGDPGLVSAMGSYRYEQPSDTLERISYQRGQAYGEQATFLSWVTVYIVAAGVAGLLWGRQVGELVDGLIPSL